MSYQPYLISNYATGFDKELQPWLLPNDAFVELYDGFVYRGVTRKRDGYSGFARGVPKSPYCESRMVHELLNQPMTGVIDGANKTFTINATPPLRRGTFVVNGSNPVQTATDNGIGGFTGDVNTATSTINYTTGAVSIEWLAAPIALSTVTATYSYHQGLPVMGIMSYWPNDNTRQLLVADTRYVNKFDPTTNRLVDVPAGTYTGTNNDFWSWVNYADASSNPRLLFANGVNGDVIQQWNGSAISNYAPTFTTGAPPVPVTLNARQMFDIRGRLVLLRTIEGGTLYPRRIRISGFGADCDNFDVTATGAGFIDIPDNTFFYGAATNKDDLIIFTEAATWILKYTNNDITPFQLQKLDGSRGSKAAFSAISYLNRTMAASPRGLILTDGYAVERMDNNIPDFSFNEISNQYFDHCYSGFVDEDRDVYLIYPSEGDADAGQERPPLLDPDQSDRILVINFEEDNYAIYQIPLSCMGNYQVSETITWADLTAVNGFPNWDTLSAIYGNWNAFAISIGSPIAIGGGHKGEVWSLNTTETEDNPQLIRNITKIGGGVIEVTTDWNNYEVGDYINFEAILGMTEINDKQYPIDSITTDWTTFRVNTGLATLTDYVSGGVAEKTIGFSALTKQLNPFIESDKKIRVGWIYFYVSVTETDLTDASGNPEPAFLYIDVYTNDSASDNPTTPTFIYKVDCTNSVEQTGTKKWVKIWINQTAKFLQFRMRNNQAGAKIQVHAMMPGMSATGRLV